MKTVGKTSAFMENSATPVLDSSAEKMLDKNHAKIPGIHPNQRLHRSDQASFTQTKWMRAMDKTSQHQEVLCSSLICPPLRVFLCQRILFKALLKAGQRSGAEPRKKASLIFKTFMLICQIYSVNSQAEVENVPDLTTQVKVRRNLGPVSLPASPITSSFLDCNNFTSCQVGQWNQPKRRQSV